MSAGSTPAPPATTKRQRAAERERKLAEFRAKEARRKRNRAILLVSGVTVAVALVAALVVSLALAPKSTTPDASGPGIEGVQTFQNQSSHVQTPVDYPQTPPAGGPHSPTWLNCGVYSEPVPAENAVHAQEHGAIWVTYDPTLPADDLAALARQLPSTYIMLSPYEGLPSPIVLSGWNVQLQVDDANDPRIPEFLEQYWQGPQTPEPGAPCTGGLDAPGRVA